MKKTKSIIVTIIIAIWIAAGVTACSSGTADEEGKINVMTSFFPIYDMTRQIGGEHVNVTNMIPTGIDPHDWTYRSQDLVNMTDAQLFIYNGAGFDDWWVDEMLTSLGARKPAVAVASEGIELITHRHGDVDPHVWLSPASALKIAENIKNALVAADPEHATDYEENYALLQNELELLHADYEAALTDAPRKEFVTSHQAFAYLARDYGLTQLSVMGLTTEAEPTSQDIKRIVDFIEEHDVKYILFEELASPELAKTLANDLGIELLSLHPIEGLTKQQEEAGETYISLMRHNLAALQLALQP